MEVVAFEDAGDGGRPREPQHLREVEFRQPLPVEADLRPLGVDDGRGVLEVPLRVGVDHLRVDHRALGLPARGIADARRVVADDEDAEMPLVLEGAHPLQRNPVAEGDVRRGDVDAELDAQRPAELELRLEGALGQDARRVPGQLLHAHAASLEASAQER